MVVLSCALPTFAVTSASNEDSESSWYSSFPIDLVQTSTGEIYPWLGYVGSDDGDFDNNFNYNDYSYYGTVTNIPYVNDNLLRNGATVVDFTVFDGSSTIGKNSYLRFLADSMVFDYFSHFRIQCGEDHLTMYQIIFSFDIVDCYLSDSDREYLVYTTHVNELVSLLGTELSWNVDIADLMWNVLEDRGYSRDNSDLLLCNVSIELCFQYQAGHNPCFVVTTNARPNNFRWIDQFKYWFRDQEVVIPSNPAGFEFDPLGWLIEVAEGFLRFEIFPGFSLDTVFNIVIILAFVLMFLRIIS